MCGERGGECVVRGEKNVWREGRRMCGERGGECVEREERKTRVNERG